MKTTKDMAVLKFIFVWFVAWIYQILFNFILANVLFVPTQITYWQAFFYAWFFDSTYKYVVILEDD